MSRAEDAAKAQEKPKTETRRISVAPEIAAELHRRRSEHDMAVTAARAITAAAAAAANAVVAVAQSASEAVERYALLHAGIEIGRIVATEGLGDTTVVVVEIPLKPEPAQEPAQAPAL